MTLQLDAVIQSVEQLPALPSTTVRIVGVATDPTASIDDILEVIQYDQNLTAQVLKLCNSAYFGLSRRIGSLKEALAYLGAMPLLQLIMGVHCNGILRQSQAGYGLLQGMLWRHSCAVALTAQAIGKRTGHTNPGILFTAGLLHDIGKVVLSTFLQDAYQQVLAMVETGLVPFHQAEKRVLGYTHAEIGELVCQQWKLPDMITCAVRYHHDPDMYNDTSIILRSCVEITHLADSIAMIMGMGLGEDGLLYCVDTRLVEKYHLDDRTVELISAEIVGEVERLEKLYETGK